MISRITMKWTGIRPLIQHNGQLQDQLNSFSKAIKEINRKGSRRMTDDDHRRMRRLEWEGSLYFDPEVGPYIPQDNVMSCLCEGAAKFRKRKDFEAAVILLDDVIPLQYDGPRTIDGLFADERFVFLKGAQVNMGSRTMRCRPRFPQWSIEFSLEYDSEVLNRDDLARAALEAGLRVGLGDYRPRYGRFLPDIIEG